ncbi:hypothetical protein [Lysinibacillus xylanilyticus]|uniref:hypothetical protein n=1 Tax=Lysinibacillus xylanilyticus TaxID=582475 RepID=UPI0038154B63
MLRRIINYLAELPQLKIDKRRKEYEDSYRAEGYIGKEFIKLSPRSNKASKSTEHNIKHNSSGTPVYGSNYSMANVIYSSVLADTALQTNNCSHTDNSPSNSMTSGSTDSSPFSIRSKL